MEIAFGLAVLALLAIGLMRRKKATNEWKAEERYEESGQWIDKRPGERGAYGSLDEEMEANRQYIARQGKVLELAELAQSFCFAGIAGYADLPETTLKKHRDFCKAEAFNLIEFAGLLTQETTVPPATTPASHPLHESLKKKTLAYLYEQFPPLLELELDKIKILDQAAGQFAERILRQTNG
jgi:hypothetical protein